MKGYLFCYDERLTNLRCLAQSHDRTGNDELARKIVRWRRDVIGTAAFRGESVTFRRSSDPLANVDSICQLPQEVELLAAWPLEYPLARNGFSGSSYPVAVFACASTDDLSSLRYVIENHDLCFSVLLGLVPIWSEVASGI